MVINAPAKLLTFTEYLAYSDDTDRRYELENGELIDVTPPTGLHADIVMFLFKLLDREIDRLKLDWVVRPGNVGVRITETKSRLPDLVVITEAQRQSLRDIPAVLESPPILAVEIVSPDHPARDYRYKRSEYAAREIGEYWIIDPYLNQVTCLILSEGFYDVAEFTGDASILSHVFPELNVTANQILSAGV